MLPPARRNSERTRADNSTLATSMPHTRLHSALMSGACNGRASASICRAVRRSDRYRSDTTAMSRLAARATATQSLFLTGCQAARQRRLAGGPVARSSLGRP
eukprot:scaffold5052_cov131-Isochrysis_galbana.AAC.2